MCVPDSQTISRPNPAARPPDHSMGISSVSVDDSLLQQNFF